MSMYAEQYPYLLAHEFFGCKSVVVFALSVPVICIVGQCLRPHSSRIRRTP